MPHILILEPNSQTAQLLGSTLKHKGIGSSIAGNGHRAISLADKQKPDAVILEVRLPGHSGFEFLYEFRSYDDWIDVPVIIFSSLKLDPRLISGPTWGELDIAKYFYKQETTVKQLTNYLVGILGAVEAA